MLLYFLGAMVWREPGAGIWPALGLDWVDPDTVLVVEEAGSVRITKCLIVVCLMWTVLDV